MSVISPDEVGNAMNDALASYRRKIRYVTELPQIPKEVEKTKKDLGEVEK